MAIKKYTELDFDLVKSNLKDYLRGQPEFNDVDFEGSGINVLLDVLAYNTCYNGFYSNMIANEMFLDTATIRNNVVSRAKALGYFPRSVRAPSADLELTLTLNADPANPDYLVIPLHHPFLSKLDLKNVYSYTMEQYILHKTASTVSGDTYKGKATVYQGEKLTYKFVIDEEINPNQRFILPNTNVDSTLIFVEVVPFNGSTEVETWTQASDVLLATENDPVYWVQEADQQYTELLFGDGYIGKKLENGNIVNVTYFVTEGPLYHGLNKFTTASLSSPGNFTVNTSGLRITTTRVLGLGAEAETTEEIKFRAPLYYDTQARAVTKSDYETLLMKDYPEIEYVKVWGGEENDQPQYGFVFVSAKPRDALTFSTLEKQSIINSIIRPRNMVSIQVEMVDPEYTNIVVNSTVKYKSRINTLSAGEVEQLVRDAIDEYADNKLKGFNSTFKYSTFVRSIDDADSSITGNLTEIQLKYGITPTFNVALNYNFSFQSPLDLGDVLHDIRSVRSTGFIFNGFETFIADDGNGNLFSYRIFGSSKIIVQQEIGTVDYETGNISIPTLRVQAIAGGGTTLYFYGIPKENDFSAIRNRILLLDQLDVNINVIDEDRS